MEDSHRQTVVAQYDKFLNDHSNTLAKAALKSPAIDQLPISAEDSYPGPQSMEEALALGRALLAGNGDLKTGYRKLGIVPAAAAAKGKGKGKEIAGGELPEEDVLKESLAGIPLQVSLCQFFLVRVVILTSHSFSISLHISNYSRTDYQLLPPYQQLTFKQELNKLINPSPKFLSKVYFPLLLQPVSLLRLVIPSVLIMIQIIEEELLV